MSTQKALSAIEEARTGRGVLNKTHCLELIASLCTFLNSLRGQHTKGRVRVGCEESVKCDHWDLGENACKDDIVFFFRFLCPPDERKNPDWSELIRITYYNLFVQVSMSSQFTWQESGSGHCF